MADSLAYLGEPVSDRTLVLNVLQGLNERFQFMVQLITRQKSFPSFADVRADLRLADLNMGQSSGTPTAFLASSSSKSPPAAPSLVGALQYLTFTRPDIAYVVQQVCLHMHDPQEVHLAAAKRILRSLQGSLEHGLIIPRTSPTQLVVYTNADWAGCPDTRRSTSGYAVFLGDSLVSWSSKRQPTVSRSSAEAEYRAVANGVAEASWLRRLLQELHHPLPMPASSIATMSTQSTSPPILFNMSAPNMWRSTSISSENVLPLVLSASFMYPLLLSLLMSSPRGCLLQYFKIFAPV